MVHSGEKRTLELISRLADMTVVEWETMKSVIDKKFESKKKEMDWQLQLSHVDEKDFVSAVHFSSFPR